MDIEHLNALGPWVLAFATIAAPIIQFALREWSKKGPAERLSFVTLGFSAVSIAASIVAALLSSLDHPLFASSLYIVALLTYTFSFLLDRENLNRGNVALFAVSCSLYSSAAVASLVFPLINDVVAMQGSLMIAEGKLIEN